MRSRANARRATLLLRGPVGGVLELAVPFVMRDLSERELLTLLCRSWVHSPLTLPVGVVAAREPSDARGCCPISMCHRKEKTARELGKYTFLTPTRLASEPPGVF